jgi:ubiquinone/menaquinone biosynthesis C-methylase UbiE
LRFQDHFSDRAALYAAYRPLYPESLFEFVAGLTHRHRVALDCGTGNGQAAVGLVPHFDRVIAIDPSAEQLRNATRHERIEYRVASADSSGLPARSVDLVTAAQALHWFDAKAFFAEAKRVLVKDGAIAVWGYGDPILDTAPGGSWRPATHSLAATPSRGNHSDARSRQRQSWQLNRARWAAIIRT